MYQLSEEQAQMIEANIEKLEVLQIVYELMLSTECNRVSDEDVADAVDMDYTTVGEYLTALDQAGLITFVDNKVTAVKSL